MPAEGAGMQPLPFLKVHMPEPAVVARDYAEIFASGIFSNSGPVEQRFAAELARWIGNDVGVSVTANATVSIQLACRALFPRDRRLVLVASFTAPAGPLAVRWAGYEPVLIDIERSSWQPDPDAAEAFLSRDAGDVAGILLTNTFGTANGAIDRWEELARRHALKLVIDSAPGFASTYPWGEPLGARGDCKIFSFHATKTVAIGEGGAIAARDHALTDDLASRIISLSLDEELSVADVKRIVGVVGDVVHG
jgi:dTDP-4-amino-4,6-dideoxygalactose transaminase